MKLINIILLLSIINTCGKGIKSSWVIEDIVQLNTDGLYESDLNEIESMKNQLIGTKVDFSFHNLKMVECENLLDNIYCFNAENLELSKIKDCNVVDDLEQLRKNYKTQGNELYYSNLIGRDFFKNFGLDYPSNNLKYSDTNIFIVKEENINLKFLYVSKSRVILLGFDFAILLKKSE